jgi:hypothetical protein
MDIIHMLLELLLPVLERLGFKRVRQYTALGCLAVGLVMTAVLTVITFAVFYLILALIGIIIQLIH